MQGTKKGLHPSSSIEDEVTQVQSKLASKHVDPIWIQFLRIVKDFAYCVPMFADNFSESRAISVKFFDAMLDFLQEVLEGDMARSVHCGHLLRATYIARGTTLGPNRLYTLLHRLFSFFRSLFIFNVSQSRKHIDNGFDIDVIAMLFQGFSCVQ